MIGRVQVLHVIAVQEKDHLRPQVVLANVSGRGADIVPVRDPQGTGDGHDHEMNTRAGEQTADQWCVPAIGSPRCGGRLSIFRLWSTTARWSVL